MQTFRHDQNFTFRDSSGRAVEAQLSPPDRDEVAQISADEREQEIWNDRELLSEAICGNWGDSVLSVRGARSWKAGISGDMQSSAAVTSGDEALAWLQRAYNAKSDNERSALLSVFAAKVYNDLIDYVQEQAAQS